MTGRNLIYPLIICSLLSILSACDQADDAIDSRTRQQAVTIDSDAGDEIEKLPSNAKSEAEIDAEAKKLLQKAEQTSSDLAVPTN